jgi:hypothetical protein
LCRKFQTTTGLKGARKLQFNGITTANSSGQSDSNSAITTGVFGVKADGAGTQSQNTGAAPGGTGASFGNGNAVGTSNGFIQSSAGQAVASGTSGGNSTANTDLTVLSTNNGDGDATVNAGLGGGLSGGTLNSAGTGGGEAGGTAMFGPSLALAIAAATPDVAAAVPETEVAAVVVDQNSKNGGKNQNNNAAADAVTAAPVAPTAPAFNFDPAGLSTGGYGGGVGTGTGVTGGSVSSPDNDSAGATGNTQFFADEAYGTALANGFGFGVGSGVAINNGGEQAGGSGGATGFGQGDIAFELDDIQNANFANSGTTTSNGGAGGYVGFNPNTPLVFGQTDSAATPSP